MNPNKVAIVFPSSYIGGSEKAMVETIQSLVENGIEIYAIFPNEGKIIELVRPFCRETHVIFYEWWALPVKVSFVRKIKFLYRALESSFAFKRYIEKNNIDVVVTATLTFPQAALGAFFASKKHIWYIHEFGKEDHGLQFIFGERLSCWMMNTLSTRILVNSKIVFKKFSELIPSKKMEILYGAIDIPRIEVNEISNPTFNLIILGRIAPGKRQEDGILALANLNKRGIPARLKLIGTSDETYLRYLKDVIAAKEMSKFVEFVDFTDDPFEYLRQSDVVIVPSRLEAFGRVTIEAMKCGKPVIASDTGASPELIVEEWNGMLYPYSNVTELSSKLERLYNDRSLRQSMSRNALKWSWDTYNLQKHGGDLIKILNEL